MSQATRPEAGPAAAPHHGRRHRHRRFHRPPESLGFGYEEFDGPAEDIPSAAAVEATAVAASETEPEDKAEERRLISRRGMRLSAWALVAVLLLFYWKWVWFMYLSAMQAWPQLQK